MNSEEGQTRIAIVDKEKCKPKKCKQECKKSCPVVRMGKLCIEVNNNSKISVISESLCIGCGICIKKCPYKAISIINLPSNLETEIVHRYGPNQFKLHRLPNPRSNNVLGLIGANGIGKSTALKILGNKLKPNLGNYREDVEWPDIIHHFRGTEIQHYLNKMMNDELKVDVKPQHVDLISNIFTADATVIEKLRDVDQRDKLDEIINLLGLEKILDRCIKDLSGGELQRFAIAAVYLKQSDVYMFDEPTSFLDIKQRLRASRVIRNLKDINETVYIVVVEHDLSILDYMSDFICCLYGVAGAYGVITMPFAVGEGINVYLDGFIPTENMRFREAPMKFTTSNQQYETQKNIKNKKYPILTNRLGNFELTVESGDFNTSEVIVLLGENGTGKTTFIKMLAGISKPKSNSDESINDLPQLNVSYKPQHVIPKSTGPVSLLLAKSAGTGIHHAQFKTDVYNPLEIDKLLDKDVENLSGGEIQRIAIVIALSKPADVYLIDEPSAHLDVEQRIIVAKAIKRFILHSKKTAFVVEHDFIMSLYLANRVIVFDGEPAVNCVASSPQDVTIGMNKFLTKLDITFRRDIDNFRPRINKHNSQKDREQKASGNYFLNDN